MSNFKDITTLTVTTTFQFQTPAVGVQNFIKCQNGEIAGWEYWMDDEDGNHLVKILDGSSGQSVVLATVYVIPGRDIFEGLFSTGAIPSKDIFDSTCVYYRVDY